MLTILCCNVLLFLTYIQRKLTLTIVLINSFTLSGTPLVKVTVDDSIVYPVTDLIANADKT